MGNPYEGQVDKSMAPSDLSWHYDYEMLLNEFSRRVRELSRDQDERAEDAEDLGDYLDMLHTLLSFRPRTRADIRTRAFEDSVSNLKENHA